MDWLVEIHYKFKLQPPTLWLTINILDRFLSKKSSLPRAKLQLVGAASFLIACKFEEIYPPEVRDCVYIADGAYTREDLLEMEHMVLAAIDCQICVPTGYHFMTRYLNLVNAPDRVRFLAFYYAERSMQEQEIFEYKPSRFAAAAVYAALVFAANDGESSARADSASEDSSSGGGGGGGGGGGIGGGSSHATWPGILVDECGYDESDLQGLAKKLVQHVNEEPVTTSNRHLISAKKKYLHDKYLNVAELIHPVYF